MTLYARSDVQAIAIGDAGHSHARPKRKDGNPVRRWALDCVVCEKALDDDILWSKSKYDIPLTDEEEKEIEQLNKQANAAMERERIAQARALAEGANVQRREEADDPDDEPVTEETEPEPELTVEPVADYTTMTKDDLKQVAKQRGLPVGGSKDDLVRRLAEYDDQPAG